MDIQALEVIASGVHALGREQAHDADGEVDRSDRSDCSCGEFGLAGFVGCGYFGGETLEGGLQLWAGCGCDEGEEEEVGQLGFWFRRHDWRGSSMGVDMEYLEGTRKMLNKMGRNDSS